MMTIIDTFHIKKYYLEDLVDFLSLKQASVLTPVIIIINNNKKEDRALGRICLLDIYINI